MQTLEEKLVSLHSQMNELHYFFERNNQFVDQIAAAMGESEESQVWEEMPTARKDRWRRLAKRALTGTGIATLILNIAPTPGAADKMRAIITPHQDGFEAVAIDTDGHMACPPLNFPTIDEAMKWARRLAPWHDFDFVIKG